MVLASYIDLCEAYWIDVIWHEIPRQQCSFHYSSSQTCLFGISQSCMYVDVETRWWQPSLSRAMGLRHMAALQLADYVSHDFECESRPSPSRIQGNLNYWYRPHTTFASDKRALWLICPVHCDLFRYPNCQGRGWCGLNLFKLIVNRPYEPLLRALRSILGMATILRWKCFFDIYCPEAYSDILRT